ncbi:uncharacterized protein [Physcomitrium patens]|uniref:Protein prenyltransferase alpha subunit repeat-containing protein 1 n=1 Tax=Physcomitrium patens TaxID=3218 RepID=A0A2K1JVM0_PHYPA|nr:protein prenyltransferase alpha subunit repeat-containing protein 1-B-like isoform X2 [Physcomitrium patens]XP_024387973.1 protein prenyltransferase alpha subunit repeat-containing protein 1-B-like isoform X2 [Physcomitrium patens]PNR45565.1 hypothetical protein PHYPA_015336 [Physcomitrium patens]|eukprot:XP_024387972.1 protein prenyltransferase alpha subunit repeat-containing protein 1-B-like isoform X2 [Physcomitrella patens]
MAEEEDSWQHGVRLVLHLDSILEGDPYIDEIGFVHPSQLESLHSIGNFALEHKKPFFMKTRRKAEGQGEADDTGQYAEDCSQRNEGHEVEAEPPGINPDQSYLNNVQGKFIDFSYDKSAFWCAHHKLAIAVSALAPIYEVARKEFLANRKAHAQCLTGTRNSVMSPSSLSFQLLEGGLCNRSANSRANGNGNVQFQGQNGAVHALLQKNLMLYSRVLVIVNCDFASAWNARKRVLSRMEATEEFLLAELRLARMVLAYGPKSEESWAYRRWIIDRMISAGLPWNTVGSVLEGDSMLVEAIAGRSRMNYRAWRHRYWLVSRMSLQQVASELQNTKRLAQLHVADNCCFHYRRCLLLGILQAGLMPNEKNVNSPTLVASRAQAGLSAALIVNPQLLTTLWKDELSWNRDLIKQFFGFEALWLHRRFLIWGFGHNSKIFKSASLPVVLNNNGSTTPLSEGGGIFSKSSSHC